MSTGPLPRLLDLRKLTDLGGEVSGVIKLDRLPRLAEFCGEHTEVATAQLRCFRDDSGHRRIKGSITTCLHLKCQRCLEPVVTAVEADVDLAVVWTEGEAKQLPEQMDPLLSDGEPLETATLLEEEILLALPLVALHDNCKPPAVTTVTDEPKTARKDNPFSVLAELKKTDK